ncbi:MAG: 2-oxoacid:acceptor oxidoreductase subunit alpha [Candidatus Sericytochromatia bacterium]|nr:2-oxoacid:acceptor oxidoreductase subunit alpha [Candidatus Tanganyikabacteria bacterium]
MALETAVPLTGTQATTPEGEPLVNDWSIQVATVNGSGSQSANMVLLRTLFQMGIPVSGKNLFPSNIAGLPTWYTIRANKRGYVGRKRDVDLLVAMNPETVDEDLAALPRGSVAIYNSDMRLGSPLREDIVAYAVPFNKLAGEISGDVKLKKLLANMVYVGVVGFLLDLDRAEIDKAINRQFRNKPKAAELNSQAVEKGWQYAAGNLSKRDRIKAERMTMTDGKIIIDGNAAAALGCVFAGCTVVAWYPITPSSSLCESTINYLQKLRVEESGKASFAVIQAEDELAALGMVIGAGWAGARAMTATSGPGISLMAEFAGLAYFVEVPAVVFDVQRLGPSTGLPTRTSQADLSFVAFLSHGDTKHIALIPGSVAEAFEFAGAAFDLAERFQTPVFVLLDLDLGMNYWMSEPFRYPTAPVDRGKVLAAADLERLGEFARYRDVDGDGIPYRTLPGTPHPLGAYFARGSGHNDEARYSEKPADYKNLMDRLGRKYDTARDAVPGPVVDGGGSKVGLIAFGTTDASMSEARDQLAAEHGIATDYLRLRAMPFCREVFDFVAAHDRVYVIEQNRDAQLKGLLKLELAPEHVGKLRSVLIYDGWTVDARTISDQISEQEGK